MSKRKLNLFQSCFMHLLFQLACLVGIPNTGNAQIHSWQIQPGKSTFPHLLTQDSTTPKVTLVRLPENAILNSSFARTTEREPKCNTSTFYMHLSANEGQQIDLKQVQTLPDGNFILAGNTGINSNQEGFISVIKNSGDIVSQQRIKINNKAVTIWTLKILLNGQFVITGAMNDGSNEVFIALMNENMSSAWIKKYKMPEVPQKTVFEITEEGNYTFAAQLNTSVVYALLTSDGSVKWAWRFYTQGMTELAGFSQIAWSEYALVINCTDNGKKAVDIFRVDSKGSSVTDHWVGNGVEEYYYGDVKAFQQDVRTVGVLKNTSGEFQLVRDIYRQSGRILTEHTYTLPLVIDFNTSVACDNAGDVMGFCFPDAGKLVFLRQFAYYDTEPEYCRQYDVPKGSSIAGVARSLQDAGFLFGLNTAEAREIILLKTDSSGVLAGCGYEPISNEFTQTINKQNTFKGSVYDFIELPLSTGAVKSDQISFAQNFDCKTAYCPDPLPEDTCLSSYFKTYRTNGYSEAFGDYLLLGDKHVVAGTKLDRVLNNGAVQRYWIKVLNEKGQIMDAIDVYCGGISTGFNLRKVDDGRFMMITSMSWNNRLHYVFTMVNDDLEMLWSKSYAGFDNYNFSMDFDVDADGNFYFVTNKLGFSSDAGLMVFKMNSQGEPVWQKTYDIKNLIFIAVSATTTNTSLVTLIEGGNGTNISVQLDKNTGEISNTYSYFTDASGGFAYQRLFKSEGDRIIYAGSSAEHNFRMSVFDTTGKPVKIRDFKQAGSSMRAATYIDGYLYGMYSYFKGSKYKNVLFKADRDLNMQFVKEYDMIVYGFPSGMNISDNGSIYVTGNYSYGGINLSYYDAYMQKYQSDGTLGTCGFQAVTAEITDWDTTTTTPKFFPVSSAYQSASIPVVFVPVENRQTVGGLLCSSLPDCNFIKITGPSLACSPDELLTFEAKTNAGCSLTPVWEYDTAFVALHNSTPLSARFSFKKTGSTRIKAFINTGCAIYTDSVHVQVNKADGVFTLGEDKILCEGESVVLQADEGFASYKWHDGSTGREFTATRSGKFHIDVTNTCGIVFSDTLIITAAVVPEMSLGKDTYVCVGDTLMLSATPGFVSYAWQSSGAIAGEGASATISPLQDEVISVSGTTGDGCKAMAAINIRSMSARPVFLGNDTSFCASQSVRLYAGEGYLNYLWSTGSSASTLDVHEAGSYWVRAADVNGCISIDTLRVLQVYALPKPNLGSDFDVCEGGQKVLDAGDFEQFLWDDGSTQRYRIAGKPGTFSVTVTDKNMCSATDEVALKDILPLPARFLKQLDSLCTNDKLTITPLKEFRNYMWSTGSFERSLTVREPGNYTLTVGDDFGCIGTETIRIVSKKECIKAVYIPSAFTPNYDGVNDVFRATIFGNVVSFKLTVYSQWGEIVFTTNDSLKGWDGSFKGMPLDPGVFVWICSFEIEGEKPAFEKGAVTLVR